MKLPEMGSVTPENDNTKFIDRLSIFGINDQKMINKLLGYGKIVDIDVFDDSLEIFYEDFSPHEKIIVRKNEIKIIDPKNNEVVDIKTDFVVDVEPEKTYIKRKRKVLKGALRRV